MKSFARGILYALGILAAAVVIFYFILFITAWASAAQRKTKPWEKILPGLFTYRVISGCFLCSAFSGLPEPGHGLPSIAKTQQTVNRDKEPIAIEIGGRHDPIIVPRAVVVVEAMTAITVFDMMMESMSSNLDRIKRFFS